MNYKVTFRWHDTDTFCTNICVAYSEEEVKAHYSKYRDVSIRPASNYEYETAERKGMPIVRV